MTKQKLFIIVLGAVYLFFVALFAFFYLSHTYDSLANILSNTYGVFIPLIGGIYGLALSRRWGGFKSAIGKAIFFLSAGFITYACGMLIWLYYNLVLGVGIPYPSLADYVFILSWPLWTVGVVFLSFATGANQGLRKLGGKVFLFIIPAAVAFFSYYFLVLVARQGFISDYNDAVKTFFDLAYPIGDVVILSISTLLFMLSYEYLGGRYKKAIYIILAAFVVNYVADFMFAYTTTIGTYYNGSLTDALYSTFMALLSLGIFAFALPDYKNKSFSIITVNPGDKPTIFHQILVRIIKKQESIIGLAAWYEANNVAGFAVDKEHGLVSFFGDGKEAVDRLVSHYESIFGKASKGVCREAVPDIIARMAVADIPASLR